jgi:hypothetical protein
MLWGNTCIGNAAALLMCATIFALGPTALLASSVSLCLTSSPYYGKVLSKKTTQSEPQVLDALDTLIEKFTDNEENAEEGW